MHRKGTVKFTVGSRYSQKLMLSNFTVLLQKFTYVRTTRAIRLLSFLQKHQKAMILLVERGKIIELHVRHKHVLHAF